MIRNSGKKRTYTERMYHFEAIESLDINSQALKIEELFSSKTEALRLLKEQYDLEISIDFSIVIENAEVPAICLHKSFIEFAAKMGVRVDIDVYVN